MRVYRKEPKKSLQAKSGIAFQNLVQQLLSMVLVEFQSTEHLKTLDREGMDCITYGTSGTEFDTIIQCKGFERPDFQSDQLRQCRDTIATYRERGGSCLEYWLVINRPLMRRSHKKALLAELETLKAEDLTKTVKLLDLHEFVNLLSELASHRLAEWSEQKQTTLIRDYRERLELVQYIDRVPFSNSELGHAPAKFFVDNISAAMGSFAKTTAGKQRTTPKFLLSSSFGYGKTSTVHATVTRWIEQGGHALYVPAALLENRAFENAPCLAEALLSFILPEDVALTDLTSRLLRDSLRRDLATAQNWLFVIDGLDENPCSTSHQKLSALWNSVIDLGLPLIVTVRDELLELRRSEIFDDPKSPGSRLFEHLRLEEWTDDLILEFLEAFAEREEGSSPKEYDELCDLVRRGDYEELYGDIPKRPLFLGMLAKDAWSEGPPARHLHSLYGRYFRQKFFYDRSSQAAEGRVSRKSDLAVQVGSDEACERLMQMMEEIAFLLFQRAAKEMDESNPANAVTESDILDAARASRIDTPRLEEIAAHSLLLPAGRDPTSRERIFRFAHRSFEHWFLARHFAASGSSPTFDDLNDPVKRFLDPMLEDQRAGEPLP